VSLGVRRLCLLAALVASAAAAAESAEESGTDRAREVVADYLGASDDAERARLVAAARALPLAAVRAAAATIVAAVDAPTETGVSHQLTAAVPGAGDAPYLVRLPAGYRTDQPHPVLVAMHHTTGNASQMASYWGEAASAAGVVLVCPQATTHRDLGWGSTEGERSAILAILRDVLLRLATDPDRVALTGMSMGGHATWELGVLHPDRFCVLLPECGGPRKELVPLLENLVAGPILWQCQGALDQPELVRAVRTGVERLENAGARVRYLEDPERGHAYFPELRAQRLALVVAEPRPPCASELELATLASGDGRTCWLRIEELDEDAYRLGQQLRLVFREKPSEEEKFRKLWREIDERLARVEAERDGNRIVLRTERITRATLLLDSTTLDPERSLVIKQGRRKLHSEPARGDAGVLLEELATTGDRRRLTDVRVEVELRP
jgi:dienelactone hydrolase